MESTQPKGPTRLPLHLANVKVAVRLRPRALGAQGSHATVPDLVHCQFGRLKLDCVLDERANNEAVFQATVRQMAEDLLRGNSSTLLLLGAPASGKSYTLEGLEEPDCHQAGLIVQTVAHLLQSSTGTGTLTAGYTALTAGPRPVLVDLLAPGSAPRRMDSTAGSRACLKPATQWLLQTLSDVEEVLRHARLAKAVGRVPSTSATSQYFAGEAVDTGPGHAHTMLTLTWTPADASQQGQPDEERQAFTLTFVELVSMPAPPEHFQGSQQAADIGQTLCKSYGSLAAVLAALQQKGHSHVPWRESALTRWLQPHMSAAQSICLLVTACAGPEAAQLTMTYVNWAGRFRCVRKHPRKPNCVAPVMVASDVTAQQRYDMAQRLQTGSEARKQMQHADAPAAPSVWRIGSAPAAYGAAWHEQPQQDALDRTHDSLPSPGRHLPAPQAAPPRESNCHPDSPGGLDTPIHHMHSYPEHAAEDHMHCGPESVVKAQRHLITSSPQSSAALRQLRLVEKESGMLRRQVLDLLHILQVQIIDLHREAAHIRAFTLAEADKAAVQSRLEESLGQAQQLQQQLMDAKAALQHLGSQDPSSQPQGHAIDQPGQALSCIRGSLPAAQGDRAQPEGQYQNLGKHGHGHQNLQRIPPLTSQAHEDGPEAQPGLQTAQRGGQQQRPMRLPSHEGQEHAATDAQPASDETALSLGPAASGDAGSQDEDAGAAPPAAGHDVPCAADQFGREGSGVPTGCSEAETQHWWQWWRRRQASREGEADNVGPYVDELSCVGGSDMQTGMCSLGGSKRVSKEVGSDGGCIKPGEGPDSGRQDPEREGEAAVAVGPHQRQGPQVLHKSSKGHMDPGTDSQGIDSAATSPMIAEGAFWQQNRSSWPPTRDALPQPHSGQYSQHAPHQSSTPQQPAAVTPGSAPGLARHATAAAQRPERFPDSEGTTVASLAQQLQQEQTASLATPEGQAALRHQLDSYFLQLAETVRCEQALHRACDQPNTKPSTQAMQTTCGELRSELGSRRSTTTELTSGASMQPGSQFTVQPASQVEPHAAQTNVDDRASLAALRACQLELEGSRAREAGQSVELHTTQQQLEAKVQELATARDQLQAAHQQLAATTQDLAAAHEQQSTTSTDLRGQLAVLQARLSDNEAGQAAKDKALEELQQQHAAGQAEVARLHADADRLRFEIGEVLTKADAETTALMGKLGACQQDNAQLHTQLQAAADSLEAAEHSMLTAVQQAEARFQQRCTEAAAAQQALLLDIGQLRQAQQAGQERQTDLERQLSAAKKREGLLVAELQGLRQQAGLLEKQRMAEVTQLSTAAADAAHFEKEACALRNQVGELQSQLKKLQRKLAQATQPGESPPQAPPQVDRSPWGANQRPEEHSDQPTPAVRPVSVQHTEGHYAQHALGKLGLDNDDLYDLNRRLFHTWTDARSELSVTKHQLMDCQVQSVLKDCNHSTSCRCHSADVTKSDQQHHHVGLFPKTPTKFDSLSTRLALRRSQSPSSPRQRLGFSSPMRAARACGTSSRSQTPMARRFAASNAMLRQKLNAAHAEHVEHAQDCSSPLPDCLKELVSSSPPLHVV